MKSSKLDQTFSAIADPTRRAILARLALGDAKVTDLAEPFPISLNSVSKHIKQLERANLVIRHRKGREHHLALNPVPFQEATHWMEQQKKLWLARLDQLERLLDSDSRSQHHENDL